MPIPMMMHSDPQPLVTLWGYCGASSLEEAGYVIPSDGKD